METHASEAALWLCRAQDGTPDDGFARAFSLITGWEPSYPETTGYIIPTLIDYYHRTGDKQLLDRCIRASDWLLGQQFPEGGIPAGTVATKPKVPTIFNTGQVIFGWIAMFRETQNEKYREAVKKACQWLLDSQDDDGAWRKHGSIVSTYALNTYNTRTAWALYLGGELLDNDNFREGAVKNIEWALTKMNDRGWFDDNCLTENARPLTHTIAYTIRGVLEVGLCARNDRFRDAAVNSARMVLGTLRPNGFLPGRLDSEWNPGATYNCLTGACQMGIIWSKLYTLTAEKGFIDGADRAIRFVCSTQDLKSSSEGIRGGIKGSFPINGDYGRFEYLNWAAKFFMDAIAAYTDAKRDH